ncbi:MAG: response regulator [Opitutus sp.]|nr:response regulator [Opitutus sp.]
MASFSFPLKLTARFLSGGAGSAEPALSILVVDDEAALRDLLRTFLEKTGHDVVCTASGNDAAALLTRHRFDLLITDILMPEGDGLSSSRNSSGGSPPPGFWRFPAVGPI